ncbi:pentraxin-related protein b6 [Ptiloglossa arizonensis]|uniref:pentraxin-related protein b6 n=1 Tax=Ptiloglossa arizonensis TaxID=3350558 RepID=UPI003F9F6130
MTLVLLWLCTLLAWTRVHAISTAWRPAFPTPSSSVLHHDAPVYATAPAQSLYDLESSSLLGQHDSDRCALYKVLMNQQLYFEYVQYKIDLPDMKEFTLCSWTKFNNHTNDHPLFSYAVGDQPRGILSWVANTARSSYYMMNIDGHNLYRLNYPLRLNKWYHSCQSWNGRTGEWQIWVNDERVGRGFNNRLVGHVIKGGGVAITGQEQRQLGGGFLEGDGAPQGSGGYLGEVTMLQLYGVALSAGKAHKDHKHHHAHHYEHDTTNNTPRPVPRPPVTQPPLPQNPYLTGGQINPQVKLNPGSPLQIVQGGVTLRHPGVVPRKPPLQPLPPVNPDSISSAFPLQSSQFFGNLQPAAGLHPTNGLSGAGLNFADGPYRNLFKREKDSSSDGTTSGELDSSLEVSTVSEKSTKKRETEQVTEGERSDDKVTFVPETKLEDSEEKKLEKRESEKKKRGLVQLGDGLIVDDAYLSQGLDDEYFSGLANFGLQLPKYENKDDEREPAEAEVRMIMDVCDGCADEPFTKALIMAWRSVPKKLYSGALHLPAAQACKAF